MSKEAIYFGILTNKILPGSTVLGFSRSGNHINKQFLSRRSETYTLVDVGLEDIKETIQNVAKDPDQMTSIYNQIKRIGLNQILFVMKILEYQSKDLEKITTASDLFLTILQGNLAFHNQEGETGFLDMLKRAERDFLKETFKLCKENLQIIRDDEEDEDPAGVFVGTLDEEIWESDLSKLEVPLTFLKSVGIFEIPPTSYETLILTAQHLSFVEFFASVGILLSSNIEAEFDKIENWERVKAVSVYIWNDLLTIIICFQY